MRRVSVLAWVIGGVGLEATVAEAEVPPKGELYVGWASWSITPDRPVMLRGQRHRRVEYMDDTTRMYGNTDQKSFREIEGGSPAYRNRRRAKWIME